MASIAHAHGYFWQTLWDLPENAELKEVRKHPHILLPGDRVTIPPIRQGRVSCATGAVHRFRRRGVPARVHFTIRDANGTPLPERRYELKVGKTVYTGKTAEDGTLLHFTDPAERTGVLTVWPALDGYPETVQYHLRVSELAPLDTLRGAKARLNGLGFSCGDETAELDEFFPSVVAAFQKSKALPATGVLDEATRNALREAFGS